MFNAKKFYLICLFAALIPSGFGFFKSQFAYNTALNSNFSEIEEQTQFWFSEQLIDHFNPTDTRTFSQRYWVNDTYYYPTLDRVLLYICPETTCTGVPDFYLVNVARNTGALLVVLEHRYYGLSVPFGNDSVNVANLEFLSVEQALADLAYFVNWFNANNTEYPISQNVSWICVGGSYGGGLATWLRETYPNVISGAWGSSAIINSILDFDSYDYQVYISAVKSGSSCPQMIQTLTKYIEWNLYNNGSTWAQSFKVQFGPAAAQLSNEQFLLYIANYISTEIEWGQRIQICQFLTNYENFDQMFAAFVPMISSQQPAFLFNPSFYNNNTWDPNWSAAKLWVYQSCSELGWFLTAYSDPQFAMRSQNLNLSFYQNFCQQSFGQPLWPNTEAFNQKFGGYTPNNSRTILVNGCEDPWQWASNTNIANKNMTAYYAQCNDCSHCVDLLPPSGSTPLEISLIHGKILLNVTYWYIQTENKTNSFIKI